jgi:hypothetical protein
MLEGVLPLHFAERLTQAEIGALYVGIALVVNHQRSRRRQAASTLDDLRLRLLSGGGHSPCRCGCRDTTLASGPASRRIRDRIGNTGSLGVLVESVKVERIVTAMVVWSQLGIVGYLLGPLLGGAVAEHFGYAAIGVLPAAAGLAVLVVAFASRATPVVGAGPRSRAG